jgi:hypothetical protein
MVSAGGLDTVAKLIGVLARGYLADCPGPSGQEMVPVNGKLFLPAEGVNCLAREDRVVKDANLNEL